ncbi:fibrobacter succinogenes major paralogous domain-containing protein [Flavobacterium xinjiangense]|uniref:Succinogenes major domain (Fib_succ_major) n=1 Tax=Flavobacterium xinjiangense TaxID=178356 RepID=A0A1M7PGP0_9FLAO|nr:FISUMP domain-containing protein [Flavobacterium xinjiangense]SHN16218.1 succinogenes major domain (Fib_succ_major) [Flavobacterium xinjiangense]
MTQKFFIILFFSFSVQWQKLQYSSYVLSYGFSVRCIKNITTYAICDSSAPTLVVPIVSSNEKKWMDNNLGASWAVTSNTDYGAYGCLHQWGRGNDGHASITCTSAIVGTSVDSSTTTLATTDTTEQALFITNGISLYHWRSNKNSTRWQGLAGTNNPCPSDYRIPTNAELTKEFTAYSITNSAMAYASGPDGGFKLVLKGFCSYDNGLICYTGSGGVLWSSAFNSCNAFYKTFFIGSISYNDDSRAYGFSVRCIK